MNSEALHRLAAFSDRPDGGNPAGVWIGDDLPDSVDMRRIAAEVGFSETAFIAPKGNSKGLETLLFIRQRKRKAEKHA